MGANEEFPKRLAKVGLMKKHDFFPLDKDPVTRLYCVIFNLNICHLIFLISPK